MLLNDIAKKIRDDRFKHGAVSFERVEVRFNIDPSGVLALGSTDLVRQKTTELLEVFSQTNRFILNSGCALPASTPEKNLKAFVETARNFK